MFRSLSFIHLFVILSICYIGGALLFREIPMSASKSLISLFDQRIIMDMEGSIIKPLLVAIIFFVAAFLFSINRRTRFTVLFIGAIKCVIFGMSSAMLLSQEMKLVAYSVWWFPFQFLSCFLFLTFCGIISPPYFKRQSRNRRELHVLPMLVGLFFIVQLVEMTLYHFFIR
ncbi:hypothetical protein ACFQ38_15135 [Sporosarcina contaminans]|uniref:Uncharacterized protein n=1 Tax=Sporosarcina contaminans TaxID=633403 RepID=A0ABW3U1D8_9BACL